MEAYPFTSFYALVGLGVFYLVMIKALQYWMRNRPEFTNLRTFTVVHNILMTIASLIMFVGVAYELAIVWSVHDWDPTLAFCDPDNVLRTPGVDFWFYVFFLSKFVEYTDTVLLILKKKDVIFLHSYHHWVTPIIVWSAAFYPISSSWMGPLTNSFVHIIMYAYYTLCEYNLPRKYGTYVTMLQLTQFIINLLWFVGIGVALPYCGGNVYSYVFLISQYLFFLYLFVNLFKNRSKRLKKQE
eukprot:TRINITY_DN10704_c0_g1_i1.p1 TRINITY_DN10704_c0_g1~~TRINITY_DN10704_c0_g1_i1.p1  ORF type:complete len:255 (-),score=30.54 TRINITY_DN10704_c0_g1_i1:146-868(-)